MGMTMTLNAVSREQFDKELMIKAVVYGPKTPSQPIAILRKDFDVLFKQAGESTIITLKGLDKPIDVLIHDVTFRPSVGGVQHIDFYAIAAGQEVTAHVPLEFIGVAPVEESGGTVSKVMYQVEVTAQAKDLPAHIEVDLTQLKAVDDKIHISDLKVSKGVTLEHEADEVIAIAAGERKEEPEPEVESAAEPVPEPADAVAAEN